MSSAKPAGWRGPAALRLGAVVLAALALSACGSTSKPIAGSAASVRPGAPGVHAKTDDPRTKHLACLQQHKLPVSEPTPTEIQIGAAGIGPLIAFSPTPGNAQANQIDARFPGAEIIGSALLFPNQGTDSLLQTVEICTALGVSG
ncbi:MAG: hypothetical protein M3Z06_15560 [Actinomycetota bacterium]|nr:hypothetical protein [Actinomycetota bacterium]